MNRIRVTKPLEGIQIDMAALERLGFAREKDPRVHRKLFSWRMFLLILLVLCVLSAANVLILEIILKLLSLIHI